MKNWKNLLPSAAALVLILTVHAAKAQSPQTPPSSAKSSPPSATRANEKTDIPKLVAACRAAVAELEAARALIAAGDTETATLRERLETEKRLTHSLEELAATQRSEAEALRAALTANSEALAAKNALISSQEKSITELKKKRASPWRRLGDILLGAGTIAILR